MTKKALIMIAALMIGAAFFIAGEFRYRDRQSGELTDDQYSIGSVEVLRKEKTIRFAGKVVKGAGKASFLAYVQGYRWMEDESAVISPAKIQELQYSLALLDWKDWDDLWYRKQNAETAKYKLYIIWQKNGKRVERQAKDLVAQGKGLYLWDFLFLGSPEFDEYLLDDSSYADCSKCPLFDIEKKTILGVIAKTGQVGLELDAAQMPPEGVQVTLEIRKQ